MFVFFLSRSDTISNKPFNICCRKSSLSAYDSGDPVITGDGQVNFTVVLKDGYTISSVTASGGYKNVKDTGVANTYRVTKVTGAVTITVTTEKNETTQTVLIGDTNLDGIISIKDVTAIQRHCAEFELLTGAAEAAADTDGDGSITIADATCIQLYLAEFSEGYGSCGQTVGVTV